MSCEDLSWSFGTNWSSQTVGFHRDLAQPGDSEVYRAWHGAVLRYYAGRLPQVPQVGAMWFMSFPNVMIEWYPLVTVISTIYPRGPTRSLNIVEYYHPKDLDTFSDGTQMAAIAAKAYLETALEDNVIGERMQAGRFALMSRGASEYGPYHDPLEAGMEHFHQYLRRQLGSALSE